MKCECVVYGVVNWWINLAANHGCVKALLNIWSKNETKALASSVKRAFAASVAWGQVKWDIHNPGILWYGITAESRSFPLLSNTSPGSSSNSSSYSSPSSTDWSWPSSSNGKWTRSLPLCSIPGPNPVRGGSWPKELIPALLLLLCAPPKDVWPPEPELRAGWLPNRFPVFRATPFDSSVASMVNKIRETKCLRDFLEDPVYNFGFDLIWGDNVS